jgi:hypothetical protein
MSACTPPKKNADLLDPPLPCSKEHLLLLLDGLASGVRRCTRGSYEMRARVPCTAGTAHAGYAAAGTSAAAVGSPSGVLSGTPPCSPQACSGGPFASPSNMSPPQLPSTPAQQHQQRQPDRWQAAPVREHAAAVTVPKLRQADIQGSLPGEAEIRRWRSMGDSCHAAAL